MSRLEKQIKYWQETASRDLAVAESLFKLQHYDACLFFCHLSLEKELKGLVVEKNNGPAPYIHDLERLINLTGFDDVSKDIKDNLKTITEFNISGRYPEIKKDFYLKCDKQYTKKYLDITKKLHKWLRKKYLKK